MQVHVRFRCDKGTLPVSKLLWSSRHPICHPSPRVAISEHYYLYVCLAANSSSTLNMAMGFQFFTGDVMPLCGSMWKGVCLQLYSRQPGCTIIVHVEHACMHGVPPTHACPNNSKPFKHKWFGVVATCCRDLSACARLHFTQSETRDLDAQRFSAFLCYYLLQPPYLMTMGNVLACSGGTPRFERLGISAQLEPTISTWTNCEQTSFLFLLRARSS